jgi:hypothetical protein
LLFATTTLFGTPATVGVRLDTSLTSYDTKPGTEFTCVVISPLEVENRLIIPVGSLIRGRVREARSLRMGFVRERAMLDLEFYEYELPDGRSVPFSGQVFDVDNARETVTGDGQIKGVLAASGTPGLLRGVWKTPRLAIFARPMSTMTGFAGHFWADAFGPVGMIGILALRWVALRFPEPEITLPPQTELKIAVTSIAPGAPEFPLAVPLYSSSVLATQLSVLDYQVDKPNGKPADDIVNLAFEGTKQEVTNGFLAAGWVPAEPLNRKTFTRMYRAYVSMEGDPRAPVSKLIYDGREPDLVFQKSLNTVARRHHIRLWQLPGRDVWLGAATHDIGLGLDIGIRGMTHKIDRVIDTERTKVVEDLLAADCVEKRTFIARPGVSESVADSVTTDGSISLVELRACEAAGIPTVAVKKPGSHVTRLVRRLALETRQYTFRDNAYHYAYTWIRKLYSRFSQREKSRQPPAEIQPGLASLTDQQKPGE